MRRNDNYNNKENQLEITAYYKVNRSDELLEFLLKKMNTSRNNVKHLLSNKQVLVNGNMVTQFNFPLAKDDEVKISKKPVMSQAEKQKKKMVRPITINILYEDEDFLAIDKPSGLLSVESDKETTSAYSYALQYLQGKNKALRPYVLHRIDKETSGVLVFAKNPRIHSMLKLNWNEYVKKRGYVAIVEGSMPKNEDTITTYLKENVNNLVYVTDDPSGQKAITHYKVVKKSQEFSMLAVEIMTGRKNQIRVHMQYLEHPIVGDEKYGYNKNPLKRLGLHASSLEFEHPVTHEMITIEARIPAIFNGLFAKK